MSELDTSSTDAQHWAEQFCKHMRELEWTPDDIDPGLMVGWFANYWAAVHDPLARRIDAQQAKIDALEAAIAIHVREESWLQNGGYETDAEAVTYFINAAAEAEPDLDIAEKLWGQTQQQEQEDG